MPDLIALLDSDGLANSYKSKQDIRPSDIYNVVMVLLVTPLKKVLLSKIPGKLSATAVAIRLHDELPQETAVRAVYSTTQTHIALHHLGDHFYTYDGRRFYLSGFYGSTAESPKQNCIALTAADLDDSLAQCTPALKEMWTSYKHLLPL